MSKASNWSTLLRKASKRCAYFEQGNAGTSSASLRKQSASGLVFLLLLLQQDLLTGAFSEAKSAHIHVRYN